MPILTLTPSPGVYTSPQTVTVSGPAGYQVIATTDGNDPVVVKTVSSSNNYAPTEYPYVQTIEDGRGRAVFDGSFPKAYNSTWTGATSFAQLDAGQKLFHNSLKFVLNGGTRLLALGDANATLDSSNGYYIKDAVGASGFAKTIAGISAILGVTSTVKDRADYAGNLLDPTYAELMNYDAILILSSRVVTVQPSTRYITVAGCNNIAQARRQGLGVYVLTDNGPGPSGNTGRYPENFYATANFVLEVITQANFQGYMDFSPGETVSYNKALHGDSPIFEGMADTDVVYASNSDSYVNQVIASPVALPTNLSAPSGYTSMKFAVISPSGDVTFEQYGYNVGQPPIVELVDEAGTTISAWPQTNLRQRRVYFKYLPGTFGNASGYVKVNDTVVGSFTGVGAGTITVDWLNTEYTLIGTGNKLTVNGTENPLIHVELYEPVVFNYTWDFNRFVPSPYTAAGEFVGSINRNEFSSPPTPLGPLLNASKELSFPAVAASFTYAEYVSAVYEAMTKVTPSLLLRPTATEIYNTFHKYVPVLAAGTTEPDANFVVTNGQLTNTVNANGYNFLFNPAYKPAYQYVRLSSTDSDDDQIGLVIGTKVSGGTRSVMYVDIYLDNNEPLPRLAINTLSFPDVPAVTAAYAASNPVGSVSYRQVLGTFPGYPAANPDRQGWLQSPWNLGISLECSFDGRRLLVRCNAPGAPASDNFYLDVQVDTGANPPLQGFSPTGGLFTRSQVGCIWTDYTLLVTE